MSKARWFFFFVFLNCQSDSAPLRLSWFPHIHSDPGEQVQLLQLHHAVREGVDPVFVHRLPGVSDPVKPETDRRVQLGLSALTRRGRSQQTEQWGCVSFAVNSILSFSTYVVCLHLSLSPETHKRDARRCFLRQMRRPVLQSVT